MVVPIFGRTGRIRACGLTGEPAAVACGVHVHLSGPSVRPAR
jgi:hypothetical protein